MSSTAAHVIYFRREDSLDLAMVGYPSEVEWQPAPADLTRLLIRRTRYRRGWKIQPLWKARCAAPKRGLHLIPLDQWEGPIPVLDVGSLQDNSGAPRLSIAAALPEETPELTFETFFDRALDRLGTNHIVAAGEELDSEGVLPPALRDQLMPNRKRMHAVFSRIDEAYIAPGVQCSLGSTWRWGKTLANAQQTPEYSASRVTSHPYTCLRLVLLQLEAAVAAVHQGLTNLDWCIFWSSLEVREFMREYCAEKITGSARVYLDHALDYVEGQIRNAVRQSLGWKRLAEYLPSLITARGESSEQPMSAVATVTGTNANPSSSRINASVGSKDGSFSRAESVNAYLIEMAKIAGIPNVSAIWVSRFLGYRNDSAMKVYKGTGGSTKRKAKRIQGVSALEQELDNFFRNNSPEQAVSLFNAKHPNWTEYADNGKPIGIPKPKQSKKR